MITYKLPLAVLMGSVRISYGYPSYKDGSEKEALGRLLFHDTSFSGPSGQSRAIRRVISWGSTGEQPRAIPGGAVQGPFS